MKEPLESPGKGGDWQDLFITLVHTWNGFFEGD